MSTSKYETQKNAFAKNFYSVYRLETRSKSFFVCKELSAIFVEKYDYTGYLIVKPPTLSKSSCKLPQIPLCKGIFKNKKWN